MSKSNIESVRRPFVDWPQAIVAAGLLALIVWLYQGAADFGKANNVDTEQMLSDAARPVGGQGGRE